MAITQKRMIELLAAGQSIEQAHLTLCAQTRSAVVGFKSGRISPEDFLTDLQLLVDQPGLAIAEWSKTPAIEEIRVKVTRRRNERRQRRVEEAAGAADAQAQREAEAGLARLQQHDAGLMARYTRGSGAQEMQAPMPVGNAEDDPEGDDLDEQAMETDDGQE